MSAMTTTLTEYDSGPGTRTSMLADHAAAKPHLVIERRKTVSANSTVTENTISVVIATNGADGLVLPQKFQFVVTVKGPIQGSTTDRDTALAVIRDIVSSDEFNNTVISGGWLQPDGV